VRQELRIEHLRDEVQRREQRAVDQLLLESGRRRLEEGAQPAVLTRQFTPEQPCLAGERDAGDAMGGDADALRLLDQHVQRRERRVPAEAHLGEGGEPAQVEGSLGSRAGSGKAVSACLSSSAMRCSSAVARSRASRTTPAGLPASGCAENASTT